MVISPTPLAAVSASNIRSPLMDGPARISSSTSVDEATRRRSSQCRMLRTMLPGSFEPTPYSVICGRGRMGTQAVGNRRLTIIAQMFIPRYSQASRKEEKSMIVTEILDMVREACPDERQAFIRCSEGRWWEVENTKAREKVSTVLRDCLHSKYKSSTKSKLAKRRERKETDKCRLSLESIRSLAIDLAHLTDASSILSGEELEMDNIFS